MSAPHGRLRELVDKLNALGRDITLVKLAQALEWANLSIGDVADFVESNPRGYNRARVAFCEQFELLVMTWLPGQRSVPHDHAGSICVMQVLQGTAIEGAFRVGADGYVDLEYETSVRTGEVTAGQDAGIHGVRNAEISGPQTGETLVTVHIYAPPLGEFRRFIQRPTPTQVGVEEAVPPDQPPTVVVVGGGFSGSMTAAQLLRRSKQQSVPMRVVLVERRGAVGEGVAYGTRDQTHLLNVPAGKMSAWPDRPEDFLNWARETKGRGQPGEFLPRMWYGDYVRHTLFNAQREAEPVTELSVLLDEVRRVGRRPDGGWLVHLGREGSVRANAVVLAIGHRPPEDPIASRWTGPRTRCIANPWQPMALNTIDPNDRVVVLGSGLTAVDAVLSLAHPRRTEPITMISRRGFLPQAHSQVAITPVDLSSFVAELLEGTMHLRAVELSRRLRGLAKEITATGVDWRSVVDGLRPHTTKLWRAMPPAERLRFLRHLRPYWEVHRHRMAIGISARFGELHDCNHVNFVGGRVRSAVGSENLVKLTVDRRKGRGVLELEAEWVINCTGPAPSNSPAANPAIGSLLVDGWLRPDELNLGLETSNTGNAIDSHQNQVANLFVVGTLRKPAEWESTAVPELRAQASDVSQRIVELFRPKQL